jgi:hypothetical protein
MSQEVKYDRNHHAGGTPEARIANRLKNSGDEKNADVHAVHGTGPTRTHTNIFGSGSAKRHGEGHPGEGDITGAKRGVV